MIGNTAFFEFFSIPLKYAGTGDFKKFKGRPDWWLEGPRSVYTPCGRKVLSLQGLI